jgi:hypothetical protein
MCKMLFIGTQNKLREVPRDDNKSDFFLEEISGEFLSIRFAFKAPNIISLEQGRSCIHDLFHLKSHRSPWLLGF